MRRPFSEPERGAGTIIRFLPHPPYPKMAQALQEAKTGLSVDRKNISLFAIKVNMQSFHVKLFSYFLFRVLSINPSRFAQTLL
jgi:hypothetical protein